MQQDSEKPRKAFPWGTPVSIFVHLAIAAVFLVNLPAKQPTPEQEQAVNVELVSPAEEKPPEEKKPEEAKKEEKKPEEKPPEKPPEPLKEVAKAEEPPPAPPPKEEAKEQAKPEPPKTQQEPKSEELPRQEVKVPLPAMRLVQEFGEKDAGPELSDKGDSAVAAGSETGQGETPPSSQPTAEVDPANPLEKPPSAIPLPKDINLPQVDVAAIQAGKDGPATLGTDEAKASFEPEKAPEQTKPVHSGPAEVQRGELKRAKVLYSRKATSDPRAQVAMGILSRGERFGQLCWTELRAQLQHSGYGNDQITVPFFLGPDGSTVLEVKHGAFRNAYGWLHQNFRCEVNEDATKIVSFAFAVGGPVDRSEWESLRITSDEQ